jgi:exopolyphosphatase/guanosine-5'-triphosphate,3'-diphosphate pyrophosphatase
MDRATLPPRQEIIRDLSDRADPIEHFAAWAGRRLGNIEHERRVLQIGGALFDLTRGLHGLGRTDRRLLGAAAVLHDVGRSVDPAEHERIGAEMILSDPWLRLPADTRRQLAYLTLYHRGPVPELARDEILSAADDRRSVRKILGLLRAADTLDSRSIDPPHLLLVRRGRQIKICCNVPGRPEKARKVFCRAKKYRLLEQTIRCSVEIQVQIDERA